MKIKPYMNNDELLAGLREEAINTISCILNDWDGYSSKQKIAAIDGVVNFLADVEMDLDLAEVDSNGKSDPV